jgi:hypothetical protein
MLSWDAQFFYLVVIGSKSTASSISIEGLRLLSDLLKSWDKRNDTLSSLTVWVKLFSISKNQRWYLIALNPQDEDEFYAICQTGDDITIDYYFLSTLSSKNAMGFSNVEREIYSFNPIKANEVFEGLLSKEYYAKGGEIEVKVLNQGEKFNQSKYKAIEKKISLKS